MKEKQLNALKIKQEENEKLEEGGLDCDGRFNRSEKMLPLNTNSFSEFFADVKKLLTNSKFACNEGANLHCQSSPNCPERCTVWFSEK